MRTLSPVALFIPFTFAIPHLSRALQSAQGPLQPAEQNSGEWPLEGSVCPGGTARCPHSLACGSARQECNGDDGSREMCCCPDGTDCHDQRWALPICAIKSWTMYRSSLTLFCCPPGQFGVYDGEEAGKCVDECGGNHNPAANCKLASAFVRGEGPSVRRYRLPTPSHSSLLPRDGNVSPTPFDENVVAPYENSAISGGAIAGIVVGAVAVTALGGFTFLMIQRRKKRKQRERAIAANSAAFFGTAAPASATTETTHNPSQTDGTVLLKPTRPYKSDLDHEDMISVVDS